MIRVLPIEAGPIALFRAEGDAAVWHDGMVWVRLAEDDGRVFVIEGNPPATLTDAVERVRNWRARQSPAP